VSSSKKEVIVGAVIVIMFSLWLINVGITSKEIGFSPLLALSAPLNKFLSWLITIFAVFGVSSGLWIISQSDKPAIQKWIERFTIKATVPSYFLYALIPLIMGLLLILMLGQTVWGLGLACLSIPSVLVFLIYGLRKNR